MNKDETMLENDSRQSELVINDDSQEQTSVTSESEPASIEVPEATGNQDPREHQEPCEDQENSEQQNDSSDEKDEVGEVSEPPFVCDKPAEEKSTYREDAFSTTIDPSKVPYHERYYLKYREGKRSVPLDLNGTMAFLQQIGFNGGEMRQARKGKSITSDGVDADRNRNNQMFCSYCGAEISGIDFYRLPDGRLRCTACSSSIVKDKSEMEELCQRVITNMDSFFGATIDVPVTIEVMDELKLKRRLGIPLGTADSSSMLILGVAVNKKKKYKILLENGAPRISLIATFAHELTHIWQYTHWDNQKGFGKCSKEKRLLIYEGMAKWVEIQYLYLVGEIATARREEYITRNRNDEYGIGFRLYEERYPLSRETMTCDDTPFTTSGYPID